jgi:hypothetical protein
MTELIVEFRGYCNCHRNSILQYPDNLPFVEPALTHKSDLLYWVGLYYKLDRHKGAGSQNIAFLHARIGKEAVSRLGVGPVLAGQRNCLTHSVTKLFNKFTKPSAQPYIFECRYINLAIGPMRRLFSVFCCDVRSHISFR